MYRLLILTLFATGCTTPPVLIGQAPTPDITLQRVLDSPESASQTHLRWGGLIVDYLTDGGDVLLLVMEHALNDQGRPTEARRTQGYFLAQVASPGACAGS